MSSSTLQPLTLMRECENIYSILLLTLPSTKQASACGRSLETTLVLDNDLCRWPHVWCYQHCRLRNLSLWTSLTGVLLLPNLTVLHVVVAQVKFQFDSSISLACLAFLLCIGLVSFFFDYFLTTTFLHCSSQNVLVLYSLLPCDLSWSFASTAGKPITSAKIWLVPPAVAFEVAW
jgi:hypothetical protein